MVIDASNESLDQNNDQSKRVNRWDKIPNNSNKSKQNDIDSYQENNSENDLSSSPSSSPSHNSQSGNRSSAASLPSLMQTPIAGLTTTGTPLGKPAEEVWVENKTSDNRTYYYNARTRESSWTKPIASVNVKVITQEDVERMAAVNNQLQFAAASATKLGKNDSNNSTNGTTNEPAAKPAEAANGSPGTPPFSHFSNAPPSFFPGAGGTQGILPPPTGANISGPPPGFPPFMPPGGMFPPPGAFPGMPPPFAAPPFGAPFGMVPPFGMMPFPGGPPGLGFPGMIDESKFYYSEETKKEMREVEEKLFKTREECSHFTEHDTQDGKKYYFNVKLNQSVWDKPKCLIELAELEAKMEELRKKKIEKPAEQPKSANKDKETELSEEEKAKQKSKPISSTAVPGTPWCVVWTRDKRVFFYNPSEKVSLWERPAILVGRIDVDKMIKEPPPNALAAAESAGAQKKKTNEPTSASEPPQKKHKVVEEEDGSNSPRSGSNSPRNDRSASPNNSQSPSREKVAEEFLQKDKIEASKEAALEAEAKAAQVRAQLPLEQRIQQFKDMLIEKDVSAYSTWEKELQKIVFDPRYLLLTSKERKQVFDKYVKDRANQESKERAAALKKKKDDFRDLLKEANITSKSSTSSFTDFAARYARDERLKAIEKMKDRESLFNDYLNDLRKQEKEEKYAEKERLKKNYFALLKEIKSLHRHSSWSETKKQIESDPRYKAIDSSSKREDYFRDHCKYLDEKPNGESKSHKDRDSHKDREKDSHRDKHKDKHDKSEDRSKLNDSSKMDQDEEENGGNDTSVVDNDKNDEDEEMADSSLNEEEKRKEIEKQERVSASLRERNKEVREQLSRIQNERDKERDQLKRDETIECFKALLIDIIKPNIAAPSASTAPASTTASDSKSTESKSESSKSSISSELSWKEAKKILKRDTRWSYCKMLEKEKKEHLFEEHMNKFRAKKREMFFQLLDDTSGVTLSSTWKEVKKLIKTDSRYEKLQQNDSLKFEKEFDNYINDKYQKAKHEFKELLLQTKIITYKSSSMIKESAQHLKEIEDILSKDKSYIVLECAAEERKKMLQDYIEQLHNEGPPPPPTATTPATRK